MRRHSTGPARNYCNFRVQWFFSVIYTGLIFFKVSSHCRSDQLNQARLSDRGLVEPARLEWSGWSTLLGIAPASYPKILDMSKKFASRDREAKRSRSHREVMSRGRVDRETLFYDCVEVEFGRDKKKYRSVPDQLDLYSTNTPCTLYEQVDLVGAR